MSKKVNEQDKDNALLDIGVMVSQVKHILVMAQDKFDTGLITNNNGIYAALYVGIDYMHQIEQLVEKLEKGEAPE